MTKASVEKRIMELCEDDLKLKSSTLSFTEDKLIITYKDFHVEEIPYDRISRINEYSGRAGQDLKIVMNFGNMNENKTLRMW